MRILALFLILIGCVGKSVASDVIDDLVVVLVDEAVIVSVVEGRVAEVTIKEGDSVNVDEMVVGLENDKQQINLALAERDVEMAETLRKQTHGIDSAQAKADSQKSRIVEHSVRMDQNRRKANNDLQVLAAQKAEAVAKNEWTRAVAARQKFSDAVSQSELDALRLAFERSQLETQEARFQQSMSELNMQLDASMLATLKNQLRIALVEIAEAESQQTFHQLETEVKRLGRKIAELELSERQVISPITGTVASLTVRPGQWVRAGDELARVIGLDRLRVEGYAPASQVTPISDDRGITVIVAMAGGKSVSRAAVARFVSPETDPVSGEVRFWIEFDNTDGLVRPGSQARIVIETSK